MSVRNKGKQERQIQTTQGVLNVRRSVLKVQQDGTGDMAQRNREILPLDDSLQITGLPFKMSPEMMAETAFFGVQESSFASAEQMIRKYLPTRISDSLIREVTEYVGRKTFEEDTCRACPIEQNPDKIPGEPDKKGILYVMVDGAAINTRLKDCQGSTWRENKQGLVFSSTDFWIRNMGEEIFSDALQILDFYHLAENIYSFGKYLFQGDPKRYTPLAEELIGLL